MPLTLTQIMAANDIAVKEIEVPEWDGTIYIRQLTRAQQDDYLKRQMGTRMKQDMKAKSQEIDLSNFYGHDSFLVVSGACDESGKPLFSAKDIEALKNKNGAVIGRIAKEILIFSEMVEDDKVARGVTSEDDAMADEIKNS